MRDPNQIAVCGPNPITKPVNGRIRHNRAPITGPKAGRFAQILKYNVGCAPGISNVVLAKQSYKGRVDLVPRYFRAGVDPLPWTVHSFVGSTPAACPTADILSVRNGRKLTFVGHAGNAAVLSDLTSASPGLQLL